jgi:hypothetical protein
MTFTPNSTGAPELFAAAAAFAAVVLAAAGIVLRRLALRVTHRRPFSTQ